MLFFIKMKMYKILIPLFAMLLSTTVVAQHYRLIVGSYTPNNEAGIHALDVDVANKKYTWKVLDSTIKNPSFLAIDKNQQYIYAIGEDGMGTVTAFAYESQKVELKKLNTQSTMGKGACFVSCAPQHVATANYGAGSISMLARKPDGSLTPAVQHIQYTGKSVHPTRQKQSYAHQALFSPCTKFLSVANLGTDSLHLYRYDATQEQPLILSDAIKLHDGGGPRHVAFRPLSTHLYLLHELDATISVLSYKNGLLRLQSKQNINHKEVTEDGAAQILISPDQKFLYATNRGTANSLSVFRIKRNGDLQFVHEVSTQGKGPRNFTISTDAKYVFVGHQYSNDIIVFERNSSNGRLSEPVLRIEGVQSPVCLVIL